MLLNFTSLSLQRPVEAPWRIHNFTIHIPSNSFYDNGYLRDREEYRRQKLSEMSSGPKALDSTVTVIVTSSNGSSCRLLQPQLPEALAAKPLEEISPKPTCHSTSWSPTLLHRIRFEPSPPTSHGHDLSIPQVVF